MVSMPMEASTVSKLAVNLVSRSRMRNRKLAGVFEIGGEVPGHLGDPGTVGLAVTPSRCTRLRSVSITKST